MKKLPCGCPKPDRFAMCINQEHMKPKPLSPEESLRKKIETIMDKHTVALTQKDDVISFDTVVANIYEAKEDLLALFQSQKQELLKEIKEKLPKKKTFIFDETKGFIPGLQQQEYDGVYNQAIDEVLTILENL